MLKSTKALMVMASIVMAFGASAQKQTLFDFGWQFTQNGKTISVDLPHDWDIYTAPNAQTGATGTGGGWYQGGKGEYRKTFKTPDGEQVRLHFEGVYQQAEVWVNGQKAGQHAYGYTPFTVDITPYLYKNKKQDNEVVVRVDNAAQPNCRWYSGSGIYRHVWLQTLSAVHVYENGVSVTTPKVSADEARVDVYVAFTNESTETRHLDDIEVTFDGGDFQEVHSSPKSQQKMEELRHVPPHAKGSLGVAYTIKNPRLWSPEDPYLYKVRVRFKEKGRIVEERTTTFGIRSISFDAKQGFLLNGKNIKLNGACVHHDDGVLGAMAFDAAEIRKVRQMKEAGFNLIRTSHNPTSRAFLDACDSLGMMVIGEVFDGWRTEKTAHDYHEMFDSCAREDVHAMVMRDRHHPSIIAWSIGNEVIERKDIRVVSTARMLKKYIQEVDNTRPVTEALCAWDRDWEIYDPHFEVLDVAGYNYMIFKHKTDHERDPKRVMWQTESYPRDAFRNWATVNDNPYVVGDMVWTGLDYLGESGIGRYYYEGDRPGESYAPGGQPEWHGAYCGDVDMTGWRKPISHYRDMLWNDGTPLYMAVKEPNGYHGTIKETQWSVWPTWESWNWPGWEGKPIEVEVYTKEPSVALYCNGTLVGKKDVSRDTQFKAVFTLPYEAGVVEAVTDNGRTSLTTAGEAARLRLTADRTVIAADGQDLSFITVEVVDREGRIVPEAAIPCTVKVSGQGLLMAAASADLKDFEPTTSPQVTTWKGRAIIVVRSARKAGTAKVTVASQLPQASLTLKIK